MKWDYMYKKIIYSLIVLFILTGCSIDKTNHQKEKNMKDELRLEMKINDLPVVVKWENNEAVNQLKQLAKSKIIINTHQYGGFEQVGDLPQNLNHLDHSITTQPGDIVLYLGNQLVLFYGSNTWAYTKLGHIENLSQEDLKQELSQSHIKVELECR